MKDLIYHKDNAERVQALYVRMFINSLWLDKADKWFSVDELVEWLTHKKVYFNKDVIIDNYTLIYSNKLNKNIYVRNDFIGKEHENK